MLSGFIRYSDGGLRALGIDPINEQNADVFILVGELENQGVVASEFIRDRIEFGSVDRFLTRLRVPVENHTALQVKILDVKEDTAAPCLAPSQQNRISIFDLLEVDQARRLDPACISALVKHLANPNLSGVIMLIEGMDGEASEAAGDFLMSEDQPASRKKALHAEKLPYFEVLLKVSSVPGTPLTASVEAYRTYPALR